MLLPAAVALALSSAPAALGDPSRADPVSAQAPAADASASALASAAAPAPASAATPAPKNVLHAPAATPLALASTATAQNSSGTDEQVDHAPPPGDPFRGMNRKAFNFSQHLDRLIVGPTARAYKRKAPGIAQTMLHNFVTNFGEPVVLANDIIQLRPKAAMTTAFRFAVNTTAGIGGLFDPASHAGAPHHDNDFGITLGRYGSPPGPYLYVPLMGPSCVRDALGAAVDGFLIDPLAWAGWVKQLEPANPPKRPFPYFHHHDAIPNRDAIRAGEALLSAIDTRARVDADLQALMSTATDPYATMRSVYLQNRAAQISQSHWRHASLPEFETPADTAAAPAAGSPAAAAAASAAAAPLATDTPASAVAPADAAAPATPAKAVLPARN